MADTATQANTLERPEDLGNTPEAVARRWKLELKLADKRESSWRKKAAEIYRLYTPDSPAANSFNILWTNTETLRQSVYNSLPQPDVRRRYQDGDPLGKAVAEVMTRALEFSQDTYDFDAVLKNDVLAMLLPGRAVSRVRYVPDIAEVPAEEGKTDGYEEISWEQVICERVQWDDFRILCAAKCWDEVNAIGFRHRLTRDDCIDKFGEEIGQEIPLDSVDDEDVKKSKDVADLFKTAEVWEIWDKEKKEVIWICPTYAKPCKTQPDPLKLSGFFDIPRPLYAIENDQTLVPSALYTQYEQQAKELNLVSRRINKLIGILKSRGIYDATLTEISELAKADDGQMVPAANVTALLERGGLEAAIWMMPIENIAIVLKELYVQRDATKQVIYEITGISDIMRSASDPNETLGAQKIKTQWGTQRLQRMQKEVQRYIRDLIRLKAEIIAEKFQPETLEKMTLVQLPHQAEVDAKKQAFLQQYQMVVQQAVSQGQPPPPMPQLPPDPITWEKVVEAMHDDATRTFRVDIETDSTLTATQDSDMEGLNQVLGGVAQIMTAFAPAVDRGAMPVEAVKEMILAVTRRAKMGSAVEDALEKMKQPDPAPDPNAAKAQADAQIAQQQMQADVELEKFKATMEDQRLEREAQREFAKAQQQAELDAQVTQAEQAAQAQQNQHQNELEAKRAQFEAQLKADLEREKYAFEERQQVRDLEQARYKTDADNATKLEIAELQAHVQAASMQDSAAKAAKSEQEGAEKKEQAGSQKATNEALLKLVEVLGKKKPVKRGPDGLITEIG